MSWITWPFRFIGFWAWFALEMVRANVTVLRDNLTPGQDSTPGIIRYSTRCRGDAELTLLASLITLTPGTLTLGTTTQAPGAARVPGGRGEDADAGAPDARYLFVHGMYQADAEELRDLVHDLESRMLAAVRRQGGDA
ncbi:Na+/H+ antiporter subunit E [Labedella endophytica]|uniref:Sodium:proton antiporter n=1 Tax=Labedella endophytica TaxID=1523160 RepID=A0A433JND8_9MICO|nr:Na+/H+ antiporter subunit E [Labedella endophytica]RUQ96892.1 sodium:proton antiporter [Labedella endophytica]